MRIAITGASGLLGRELIRSAGNRHKIVAGIHSANSEVPNSTTKLPLDLNEHKSIAAFVEAVQADILIHSAAITDVDFCEREPEIARAINAEATRHIASAVKGLPTRIVYISTDYVFDGQAGPYAEVDSTDPINVYGQTKLDGERLVLDSDPKNIVVRSSSFLGCGGPARPTFLERMLESMREHPPLCAAIDQLSNITPVDELASGILKLVESGQSGIWHIAHPRILSRYELAVMLSGVDTDDPSEVERVEYASLKRPAARPLRGGLNTDKASRALQLSFRPLEASLLKFLSDVDSHRIS